jgi:hypothetical protein
MAGIYAADLADMRSKVVDWADTAVIADSVVDDFINISVGKLADAVRVRSMEATTVLPLSPDGSVAIPDDYTQSKSFKVTVGGGQDIFLERKALDYVEERNTWSSGYPQFFARKGDRFVLATMPSGISDAELIYYREPDTLVADTDTDWFITNATSAVLFGALVELGAYTSDEEFSAIYTGKFTQAAVQVQAIEDAANWSGDTLSIGLN